MLEDVRNYVRAGIGAVASQGADAIPGAVASRAQALAEQFASFAAGFLEWSGEARASILTELKLLVAGQIQEMGLASQEDVDRLARRVRQLEERLEKSGSRSSSGSTRRPSSSRKRAGSTPKRATSTKASSGSRSAGTRTSSRGSAGRGRSE